MGRKQIEFYVPQDCLVKASQGLNRGELARRLRVLHHVGLEMAGRLPPRWGGSWVTIQVEVCGPRGRQVNAFDLWPTVQAISRGLARGGAGAKVIPAKIVLNSPNKATRFHQSKYFIRFMLI